MIVDAANGPSVKNASGTNIINAAGGAWNIGPTGVPTIHTPSKFAATIVCGDAGPRTKDDPNPELLAVLPVTLTRGISSAAGAMAPTAGPFKTAVATTLPFTTWLIGMFIKPALIEGPLAAVAPEVEPICQFDIVEKFICRLGHFSVSPIFTSIKETLYLLIMFLNVINAKNTSLNTFMFSSEDMRDPRRDIQPEPAPRSLIDHMRRNVALWEHNRLVTVVNSNVARCAGSGVGGA